MIGRPLSFLLMAFVLKSNFGQNNASEVRRYGKVQQFKSEENPNLYPYMMSLQYKTGDFKCGALLVTSVHVLTPCHCITELKDSSVVLLDEKLFRVVAGSDDLSDINKPGVQIRNVDYFILHPGCTYKHRYEMDFAIAILSEPFDYSLRIQVMDRFIRTRRIGYRKFLNNRINKTLRKCTLVGWRDNRIKEQAVNLVEKKLCLQECQENKCTKSENEYVCIVMDSVATECPLLDKGSVLMEEGFIFAILNSADCERLTTDPIRFSLLGSEFIHFYDEYNPDNESNGNFPHLIVITITMLHLFLSI